MAIDWAPCNSPLHMNKTSWLAERVNLDATRTLACHNKHFFLEMNLQLNMQIIPEKKEHLLFSYAHPRRKGQQNDLVGQE